MKLSIVYKLSLTAVLLVLLSSGLVGRLFYIKTTELLVEQAAKDIAIEIRNAGNQLQTHIDSLRADTLFLANTPPIQGILRTQKTGNYDKQREASYHQWEKRLQSIFTTMLGSKPTYLRIHFINKFGQEMVVVGYEENKFSVVSNEDLQNKAQRLYVRKTLKLPAGSVYLSEINLNREHGKVTKPHREVIRSATPVYDEINGEISGLVVIAAEIGNEFKAIQKHVQNEDTRIYITNDHGGYLSHPDQSKAYGFDLGKRFRIQEDFPRLATLYLPDNTDDNFILLPQNTNDQHVVNFTKIAIDLEQPNRFIAVGITQPYRHIVAKQTGVLNNVILLSLGLAFAVTLLAILFSYRLFRPIKQITQVMDDYTHNRQATSSMPTNKNDEIGVLAKSYISLINQVEDAKNNLREMNQNLEAKVIDRTQALEASEIFQRRILETMVDGLIVIDDKGIITSFNSAALRIFGYQRDDVIGKAINMLMPEPYHSEHNSYLETYFKSGIKKVIDNHREVAGLKKDGSIFPLDLSVSEIVIDGQRIYSGVVRDITERKQVEKMKNEFVSTVSHELRTPLTAIRGSLGLVNGGAVGEIPTKANELLKIAGNNTERLLLLINDILDIQKIESGQMAFKFQSVDLMYLIKQSLIDNKAYGEQYDVEFIVGSELEEAKLFADKDRLMQVMANLLSNAAKFSPRGGKVIINVARHKGDVLRISVTDHGPGIPLKFQPKLFEKFTQSDSSTTRQKGGTGLGLSITKVIVEKHGGRIDFISREGIGTTFIVELSELISSYTPNEAEAPRQLNNKFSRKILIVENDPDIAALLRRILTEAGYNGDISSDISQAQLKLKKNPDQYEAITLDLDLPGQDNMRFLNDLQETANLHDIPLVLISAQADENKHNLTGRAISITDWLQKPIDSKRLINAIKKVIKPGKLPRVLHVEDEADVHKLVRAMLKDQCDLSWTNTLASSQQALEAENFDLVLLDIGLPDGSGLDLLTTIEHWDTPPSVVIYSAFDVADENAAKVSAVLEKSKTDHLRLVEVINQTIIQRNNKP